MKKVIFSFLIFSFIIITYIIFFNASSSGDNYESDSYISNNFNQISFANLRTDEPVSSPDLEKFYFERWHEPYDAMLPQSEMDRIWNEINALPLDNDTNKWICVGPAGMEYMGGPEKFTGRILDIETYPSIRIATANGSLWTSPTTSISDSLTCLAIGSFDSKLGDPNTIIVGTGEYGIRSGTGLWKTIDGGLNWSKKTLNPEPTSFFRIRYHESSQHSNMVFAATDVGFFHSNDNGENWTLLRAGIATDFATNNYWYGMLVSFWGEGLYKGGDTGGNLTKLTTGGIPTTNVGRTSISAYYGWSNIYVSMAKNSDNKTLGVYRSTDRGDTWTNVTPNPNFLGDQGWYANEISHKSKYVLAGGIELWRSNNYGDSWTKITDSDLHIGHHSIGWGGYWVGWDGYRDAYTVYDCNDGGLAISNDTGLTWSTAGNTFPITQYYSLGVDLFNSHVIYGGSQSNGLSRTIDGGTSWDIVNDGSVSGISVDPNNYSRIFATCGLYESPLFFRPIISTNTGQNWTQITTGLPSSNQILTRIDNDLFDPVNIFTNLDAFVNFSNNYGQNWFKLNETAFPCDEISNITVTGNQINTGHVYACLYNTPPTANKLRVYDGYNWHERSEIFPSTRNIRIVIPHHRIENHAFAIVNGIGTPGQKVYKTINTGINWINITGNLPDVPLSDLVTHPFNDSILYLGSEFGCFKTTNSGVNWTLWNNGMPKANTITEMSYINKSPVSDTFYVVASSFGRSMWKRKVDESVININKISISLPNEYRLYHNFPNPFNPIANIRFDLPKSSQAKLIVYDILGKEVSRLVNGKLNAGSYIERWDGSNLPSGVYFYQLEIYNEKSHIYEFIDVKKMILIK